MNQDELAILMHDEISQLLELIDENTIEIQMNDKLLMEEDSERSKHEEIMEHRGTDEINILNDIDKIRRKKGSLLTEKQFQCIAELLEKYPDSHGVIKKRLGLSNTTFYRIKKQIEGSAYLCQSRKRKLRSEDLLSETQKAYLARLLTPPSIPLTIPSI